MKIGRSSSMKVSSRRVALSLALCMAAFACGSAAAQDGPWPNKSVRILATSPPGGSVDLLTRIVAEHFTKVFGKPFVVENKPGANGNIAVDSVVRAPADGYMLFVTIPGVFAINRHLFSSMPFDPDKDIAPIALLGESPLILVVPPTSPVKNFAQFLAWARASPGKLAYASAGVGTTGNLAMELLKQTAGLDILHVPYKGNAAATTDLLAGRVQVMMDNTTTALPHIRESKLLGLAVAESSRIASAPEIPTIAESGVPGYEVIPWFGLGTKAGVPHDIIDKLNAAANEALAAPENQKRLATAGIVLRPMSASAFSAFVKTETVKWGETIRVAGATLN